MTLPPEPPPPDPPPPGGRYQSDWYVTRAFEEHAAKRCLDHAQPVLLWGPGGQGCSWLCRRVADTWRQAGPASEAERTAVVVDFGHFGPSDLGSLDACLAATAEILDKALHPGGAPGQPVAERWAAVQGTPKTRFSRMLDALLRGRPGLLLVVFDHADLVHARPYYEDFATLLRSHAEQRDAPWDRLRLVVSVSVPPERLRTARHASPFANLSEPIEVGELGDEQVTELAHQRALRGWTPGHSGRLRAVVGGHPYLLCAALDDLREQRYRLEDLESGKHPLEGNAVALHVQRVRRRLDSEPLRRAFAAVATGQGTDSVPPGDIDELVSRGLVVRTRGMCAVRYRLYQRLLEVEVAGSGKPALSGPKVAKQDVSTALAEPASGKPALSRPKIALATSLGFMLLAVLILLLPSMKSRLIVGGVLGLGILVFIIVLIHDPRYFYRRLIVTNLASGIAIHATGFTVKAGGLLEWNSQTGIGFSAAWAVITGMLIWAELRERR